MFLVCLVEFQGSYECHDLHVKIPAPTHWLYFQVKTKKDLHAEEDELKKEGNVLTSEGPSSFEQSVRVRQSATTPLLLSSSVQQAQQVKPLLPNPTPDQAETDKNLRRSAQRICSLHTQHFLELFSLLQKCNNTAIRTSVFGLYVVENHLFPTCLRVCPSNGDCFPSLARIKTEDKQRIIDESAKLFMASKFVTSCGQPGPKPIGEEKTTKKSNFKLQLLSCYDYIDMLNPEHMSSLFSWLQYIVHCESRHNSY